MESQGGNTNHLHGGPQGGQGGNTNHLHGGPQGGRGGNTNHLHGGPQGGQQVLLLRKETELWPSIQSMS